jgi:hypothetical protein
VGSSKLIATGLKLKRKSLSGLSCLLEICLNRTSSPGDELKNCISRPVKHIRRTGVFRFKFIRNSGFNIGFQRKRICLLTSHCSPRTHSAPDISASKSKLTQFDRLDKFVVCFLSNARWPYRPRLSAIPSSDGGSSSGNFGKFAAIPAAFFVGFGGDQLLA